MKWMRCIVLCSVFLIVAGCDSNNPVEEQEVIETAPTLEEVFRDLSGTWYFLADLNPNGQTGWGYSSNCRVEFKVSGPNGEMCLNGSFQATVDFKVKIGQEGSWNISIHDDSTLAVYTRPSRFHMNLTRVSAGAATPNTTYWALQADGSWSFIWDAEDLLDVSFWKWNNLDSFQRIEADGTCRAKLIIEQNTLRIEGCVGSEIYPMTRTRYQNPLDWFLDT